MPKKKEVYSGGHAEDALCLIYTSSMQLFKGFWRFISVIVSLLRAYLNIAGGWKIWEHITGAGGGEPSPTVTMQLVVTALAAFLGGGLQRPVREISTPACAPRRRGVQCGVKFDTSGESCAIN
jgi:hypothetical protein